jgi:hypothetical protein
MLLLNAKDQALSAIADASRDIAALRLQALKAPWNQDSEAPVLSCSNKLAMLNPVALQIVAPRLKRLDCIDHGPISQEFDRRC